MCISIQRIIQGLVPVIIMSALCACSNAERTTRRADAAMAIGEYQEAASLYRRAYMQTSPRERASRGVLAYKMGEAYRSFGNVGRALAAYKNAERFGDADSLLLRKQGDMLRYAGNYKGAEEKYKAYLEKIRKMCWRLLDTGLRRKLPPSERPVRLILSNWTKTSAVQGQIIVRFFQIVTVLPFIFPLPEIRVRADR